jgi:phosphoribosyl 1,2-cyclic phosphate phosphodiesterase
MTRRMTVTILGSGTSTGVPVIGCPCSICVSPEQRNHRLRASIMITTPEGEHLVVDTGPDFRAQMLTHKVSRLEHVLYTHTHADHCHGFDDLRAFYFHQKSPVLCYLYKDHVEDFKSRFAYAFDPRPTPNSRPQVTIHPFAPGSFTVSMSRRELTVETELLPHGKGVSAAFKIGPFVYATDFKEVPEITREKWRNQVHTMVASGVRFHAHPTHSSVPETIDLMMDLGVQQGIITHLGHEIAYERDNASLPQGMALAYDGMTIDVDL